MFVDPDGAGLLTQFAAEHTGRRESLHAAEHAARREVADTILAAEVRRIAALAPGDAAVERAREAVAELLCGFPVYRSYLPEGRGGARRRRVGGPHPPPRPRRRARRALRRDARRPARRAGHPRAADLRHGDGQGRRGHRVLPVEPVRRAQRGRRRPDRFGVAPAEFHAAAAARGRRLAGDHDHALHPRHQALRGRAGPPRRARRDAPGVGRPRRGAGRRATRCPTARWSCWLADPRRRVADPGRAAARLPRRRPPKEAKLGHQPRRGGAGGRRGGRGLARGGARRRRAASPRSRRSWPGSAPPGWSNSLGPEAAAARRARACPTSTRAPSCGSTRWSTRTTAARSTAPARRDLLGPLDDGLAARRSTPTGRRSCCGHAERAAAAPRPAGAVHRLPRRCPPTGPAAGTRSRSTRWRRWSRWRPGCRSGWPRAAAGATRCSRCPTAR